MRARIDILSPGHDRSLLVSLDEEKIFQAPGERSLDMLVEILQSATTPHGGADRFLAMVFKGGAPKISHERAALLPGALSWCHAPRRLKTDTVRIRLDFASETVAITGLADGDLRDFRTRLPERAPFEERELRRECGLLEPAERGVANHCSVVEANTLITGMIDAVTPGAPRPFPTSAMSLAGILAGLGGHAFGGDISGPARGGAQSLSHAFGEMRRYGIQLHDRPWRPTTALRGKVLEACIAAADPACLDLGRRLGPILAHRDARIVEVALLLTIDAIGQDPIQFGSRRQHGAGASAHDRAAAAGLVGALAEAAGAYIPGITK